MRLFRKPLYGIAVLLVAALASGCGRSAPVEKPMKPMAAKPAAAKQAATLPGLAELSPADRALAEKQKICPVSGELLGEHGKPIKITVKGEVVFICCAACEDPLKKNPDKYLAKLKPAAKPAK